jgi:hypothetical protein
MDGAGRWPAWVVLPVQANIALAAAVRCANQGRQIRYPSAPLSGEFGAFSVACPTDDVGGLGAITWGGPLRAPVQLFMLLEDVLGKCPLGREQLPGAQTSGYLLGAVTYHPCR